MSDNVDDFLAHYGVKGMRWGVTKAQYKTLSKEDRKGYRKKSFRERAATLKEAQVENAKLTIDAAKKGGSDVFIQTKTNPYDSVPTIMTGKEFTRHLESGGAFDVKVTAVFGYTNTKSGKDAQTFVDSHMDDIWAPTAERYVKKNS
jgi:hypothetical protein